MNKFFSTLGMCVLGAWLLAGCSTQNADTGIQSQRLDACTADGSIFEPLPFKEWKGVYHAQVSKIIEAHMQTIEHTADLPLQCTAESYGDLVPASEILRQTAALLPAYQHHDRLASLNETDMAPVLLEFLRVYECSLSERERYLSVRIPKEAGDAPMSLGDLDKKKSEEKKIIAEELTVARPALERTLSLVNGFDRLRPLSVDIECIKRASLDIRNILGLASDASSCLPRVWDTHQSLRDLE